MNEKYGMHRVKAQSEVMPLAAWQLDNQKLVYDHELLISVKTIQIEASSMKQICIEEQYDIERIKDKIINIVKIRGKLHNPFTDTGGILSGVVEKIGRKFENPAAVGAGDEVLLLTSLTMIPLQINKIHSINMSLGQIEVDGYCIVYGKCVIIKKPKHLPLSVLLLAFEESGSIYHAYKISKGKNKFLIVGSNELTPLLYAYAIRKAVGADKKIAGILDTGIKEIPKVIKEIYRYEKTFDTIYEMNTLHPLSCYTKIMEDDSEPFDLSINCATSLGSEMINVLATKSKGTVFLPSFIGNHKMAMYMTEGTCKELEILGADGYMEGYIDFMIGLLSDHDEIFKKIVEISMEPDTEKNGFVQNFNDDKKHSQFAENLTFDFIYKSQAMCNVINDILKAAKYDCSVLIQGDTGTGKEKTVNLIHLNSMRKLGRCVKVNCASIPDNLMEAEFFGYEPGSFTGANQFGKIGYFEMANNGILFLDEISELSFGMQAKLLRVLQDKEYYKVGGIKPMRVNTRIIAASNKDLGKLTAEDRFRKDLYYRLNVLKIDIPPLRERKIDILPLTEYFLKKFNDAFGMNKKIEDEGLQYLLDYGWPGNVRELENLIQRLLVNSNEQMIGGLDVMKELNREIFGTSGQPEHEVWESGFRPSFKEMIEQQEKEMIRLALISCTTTRKAAELIGISQTMLVRKKNKYNL